MTLEQSVCSPTCVFDIRTVYVVDSLLVTTSPTEYLTLEQNVCGRFPASHYKSYCVFDIRTECM